MERFGEAWVNVVLIYCLCISRRYEHCEDYGLYLLDISLYLHSQIILVGLVPLRGGKCVVEEALCSSPHIRNEISQVLGCLKLDLALYFRF